MDKQKQINPILWILSLALMQGVQAQKPNVVVVLADDIGTGDISYYRKMHAKNIILETPNIDTLAAYGMVFTDAHSPAALCAPSRYAIMTGNNCYRSAYPWGVWSAFAKSPIGVHQLTLGKLMQNAGYKTAFLGKWHLGGSYYQKGDTSKIYHKRSRNKLQKGADLSKIVAGGPQQNGFDYSLTFPAGIQDVPYMVYENATWLPLAEDSKIVFISHEKMAKIKVKLDKEEGPGDSNWNPHHAGPLLVDKAVAFINKYAHKKEPFFMYYCSQAVHLPHTPPDSLEGVAIKGTTPTRHLDMIKALDAQVGMIIKALKKKGIYHNTLIIFTSDNGGLALKTTLKTGHDPSDIYRGAKNKIYEGGHRVPFIVSWPKMIKNRTSDAPVLGLDILATLAEITDTQVPVGQAVDSHSLWSILQNKENAKGRSRLIVQGGTERRVAITEDNWKLIIQIDKTDKTNHTREPIALFNLSDNPTEDETWNFINNPDHKTRVDTLFKKYNKARDSKK